MVQLRLRVAMLTAPPPTRFTEHGMYIVTYVRRVVESRRNIEHLKGLGGTSSGTILVEPSTQARWPPEVHDR